jgi:acyl-CoA thioester hydrolase
MDTPKKDAGGAARTWHEHTLRVRYGETDQMGVVYHANYLVYMEEGRTRLMESLGASYAEVEASGYGLVVRRADLRYRAPATYDQRLLIRTRVGRLRGASVNFEYQIHDAASEALLAEGSTELACIHMKSPRREPCLLPEELRERLTQA